MEGVRVHVGVKASCVCIQVDIEGVCVSLQLKACS